VLALGAEAAERLNAPQIGPEHLLLGLIRDPGCAAVCSILEKHGITEAAVLREIGASDTSALEPLRPAISRETLSALVAALPERALNQAHAALTRLQVWPPAPPHVPERITEIQNEMHRRFQESARQGVGMIGGSGGAWRTDPQGKILNGSLSSARMENGAHVTETHRFFQGHEITIIERTRIREEEKLISYSQEIRGPGRQHRFEVDFEIG
jgi:hypothetical protein